MKEALCRFLVKKYKIQYIFIEKYIKIAILLKIKKLGGTGYVEKEKKNQTGSSCIDYHDFHAGKQYRSYGSRGSRRKRWTGIRWK